MTATTPFETVCKQFINGSVPFSYSLNSGFDTGNDSWFSSGAWQVGTPVQKMPACTGVGGGGGLTQRARAYRRWSGSQASEENPFPSTKKKVENQNVHRVGGHSIPYSSTSPLTCTQTQCQDPQREMGQVISILLNPYSQLRQGFTTEVVFTKLHRIIR